MMKPCILGFVLVSVACTGAPASPPTAPNVATPASSAPLTESERSHIASQLSAIAVDAIEQAIPEAFSAASSSAAMSPSQPFVLMQPDLSTRYGIYANHSCDFPGGPGFAVGRGAGSIRSTGFIEVAWAPGSSGTITATLTMSTINTCSFGLVPVHLGPTSWALDTSGLKVISTLEMTPNGLAKRQVFKLVGTLVYFKGPYTTSMAINLTHTYPDFPRQPVNASGQFGDMNMNRTLPEVERLPRIPASPSTLTGQWTGQMAAVPNPNACPVEWDLELNLQASSSDVSGMAVTRNTRVVSPSCRAVAGAVANYGVSGSADSNGNISFAAAGVFTFQGQYSATRMSGRFVVKDTGQLGNFAVHRQ